MNYTTRYLRSAALIFCSLFLFFHGCPFTKKHDVRKISAVSSKVSDARTSDGDANDPNVWVNPYSASSPIYSEFDEFRKWVLNNRKLAAVSGTARPGDLLRLSGRLEAQGIPRLPTDLLEKRLSSVNKILASLDTRMCSKLIKGGISAPEFTAYASSIMESFDDEEAKAWFLVNKAAIEAQLDGSPLIVLPTEDATRGILKIAKSMYEPQSKAFISGLAGLKTESNEDACATVRILYSKGNSLPEPYRGYIARMLLTGKEGNEKP
jgi:hypothetical protein